MPAYRFHCKNPRCGGEFLKHIPVDEFDKTQYSISGHSCYNCGTAKMAVCKSNKRADDGFKPGFQRNIGKHCGTYAEYKAHLKARGLVEYGYEDFDHVEKETEGFEWPKDMLRDLYKAGGYSDRELEALNQGKMLTE